MFHGGQAPDLRSLEAETDLLELDSEIFVRSPQAKAATPVVAGKLLPLPAATLQLGQTSPDICNQGTLRS